MVFIKRNFSIVSRIVFSRITASRTFALKQIAMTFKGMILEK